MPLISSHNPSKAIPGNLEWSGTLAEDFLPSEIIGSCPVPQRPGTVNISSIQLLPVLPWRVKQAQPGGGWRQHYSPWSMARAYIDSRRAPDTEVAAGGRAPGPTCPCGPATEVPRQQPPGLRTPSNHAAQRGHTSTRLAEGFLPSEIIGSLPPPNVIPVSISAYQASTGRVYEYLYG